MRCGEIGGRGVGGRGRGCLDFGGGRVGGCLGDRIRDLEAASVGRCSVGGDYFGGEKVGEVVQGGRTYFFSLGFDDGGSIIEAS